MLITAHIAAGLVIGKVSGQWAIAIVGATIMDVDHLITYARHGLLHQPKKLWKALMDPRDPYGNQRNVLHNVFVWAIATALLYRTTWGMVFCIAWASHLLLDALDASDARLFWPWRWNLRGPVPYGSGIEWTFTAVLLAALFFL